MDTAAYLKRIDYSKPVKPDVGTLHELQLAHLLTVPFENLNIGWKRPIRLDFDSLWTKLILQRRGGFCYELNGLFAELLKTIGYEVLYLNARVFNSSGKPGMDFDHLALLVRTPGGSERWLVDVGFGDSFLQPLNFEDRGEQLQGLHAYRIEEVEDEYVTWQRDYDGTWERQYLFDLRPHKFPDEYEAGCLYHQTSPLSSFTRRSIISKATADGRISLETARLIVTRNGLRSEQPVHNQVEFQELLQQYFDITIPKEYS
jgi:N-hydroxyarylamine O-acetyltransferase